MNHCKDKWDCMLGMASILSSAQRFINKETDKKIVLRIISEDIRNRAESVIQWECNILKCFKEK